MTTHWTDRLSDYIDGELPSADAAALEAHVAECPSCAETLGELRALVASASMLPDTPPERDLWPEIEGRLRPRTPAGIERKILPLRARARLRGAPAPARTTRRVAFTIPQLLAAGIALIIFSAGGAWVALGAGSTHSPVAATGPAGAESPAATTAVGGSGSVMLASSWEAAVRDLETEFDRRRPDLDPATIQVVERNLAIVDAAIAEARQALEADPASQFLNGYLAGAVQRKVDLLRQANRIQRTES